MTENNSEILQKKMDRRAVLRAAGGALAVGTLVGFGKRFLFLQREKERSLEASNQPEPVIKVFPPETPAESSLSPQELNLIILGQLLVSQISKLNPEREDLKVVVTKLETVAFEAGEEGNNIRNLPLNLGESNKIGSFNAGEPVIPTAAVEISYLQDSQNHEEIWLIVGGEPNKEENKYVCYSQNEEVFLKD